MLPATIKTLAKLLSKIPSIGPKSAEKLAIWFASDGRNYSQQLGTALINLKDTIGICELCGYFTESNHSVCSICSDSMRQTDVICIVEQLLDVVDIEESNAYKGKYFILGGVISPLEGKTIGDLPFEKLKIYTQKANIKEIIVALGATTEADVTTMYLKELFKDVHIEISVLARGLAVGTKIQYAGKKSLLEAFRTRDKIEKS